jgi:hypothetical protein
VKGILLDVPSGSETVTSTTVVPDCCAGADAVQLVALVHVAATTTLPKETVVCPLTKLVPVSVTEVPAEPLEGVRPDSAGAGLL